MELVNKIKNIKSKTWIKIILVSIFLMMLVLNLLTPLIADDYSYALNVNGTRLSGIMDIINFQIRHYLIWGGRTVAHSIAQLFLMMPKFIFDIFNSLIYTLLIGLIYKIAKGKNEDDKPCLLLGIHFALYFLSPVFGQNCIWLVGSCNYIWTTTLILLMISQFVLKGDKKDTILRIIGIFLLGIIAGWTNENTSFGLIVFLVSFLIINRINKEKISKWKISGLIGVIIGFITMIAAPGNYVRSAEFVDNDFIIIKWIKRFANCTLGLKDYCLPLIIALVILFTIYIYNHKKINKYIYAFILAAVFSVYSMILSPEFPPRSWFGVIVFFIIAIFMFLYNIEKINKIFKPIILDIIVLSSFLFVIDYMYLAYDIYGLKNTWEGRIEIINNSDGSTPIVLYEYGSKNSKNPNYGLSDISLDKDEWPNKDIARYYNKKEGIIRYVEEINKE